MKIQADMVRFEAEVMVVLHIGKRELTTAEFDYVNLKRNKDGTVLIRGTIGSPTNMINMYADVFTLDGEEQDISKLTTSVIFNPTIKPTGVE